MSCGTKRMPRARELFNWALDSLTGRITGNFAGVHLGSLSAGRKKTPGKCQGKVVRHHVRAGVSPLKAAGEGVRTI